MVRGAVIGVDVTGRVSAGRPVLNVSRINMHVLLGITEVGVKLAHHRVCLLIAPIK